MRIVRTPFALSVGRSVRIELVVAREALGVPADASVAGPGRAFRDLIREISHRRGPLRTIDHRPPERPRPFARHSFREGP
jgi:hypothetical protein